VATEIAAMGELGELSRRVVETALSNEVITPGVTTLEDVAWWIQEWLAARDLDSRLPSVYVISPNGIGTLSGDRIIQRGDLLTIDMAARMMNLTTDVKRIAYVLRSGETSAPQGFVHAFERAREAYAILRRSILPGQPGTVVLQNINRNLSAAGFNVVADEPAVRTTLNSFEAPTDGPQTDVITVCHSLGNLGHDVGPSLAVFNPYRLTLKLLPTNFLSIELFAWTPAPEWGGKKVHIHLEDDAVVTERGVEWLYPVADRIRLIR
jgi:Xaa-Pro aminopeptidase